MDTLKTLQEIVSEYKGTTVELKAETTFADLGFDSLDQVELVMQVEDKFGITLGDDLMVTNVGELVAKIDEQR